MPIDPPDTRVFLFLQGPHGPFFARLGHMLRQAGAEVWRVGFNAGDRFFWRDRASYLPFRSPVADWPAYITALIEEKQITDLVLYGDAREAHSIAIDIARKRGLEIHVFEEGYLRPYWVTYERGGTNGNSRLMRKTVPDMRTALNQSDLEEPMPPASWGDMREHVFYGALYHWFVMFFNYGYRKFKPHRGISVAKELRLYLFRLFLMPLHALDRIQATMRIRYSSFPYHLALLQLAHDANFRTHSPFNTMDEFLETVIEAFAYNAPRHHHLVFKAHPLEDGRVPLRRRIRTLAAENGIKDRVHYVRGGKLARLLSDTRSAVTVNSTAAQQVLWRGIPLKAFGDAVYAKPEFVSDLPIETFFSAPSRPDMRAYKDFRRYLLETSQVPGGFYSRRGRGQLLRAVIDMMLSAEDPYDALASGSAAPRQQLRVVH